MPALLPCVLKSLRAAGSNRLQAMGASCFHFVELQLSKKIRSRACLPSSEDDVNFVPACQQDLSDNGEVIPPKCRDISVSFGSKSSYFKLSTRVSK